MCNGRGSLNDLIFIQWSNSQCYLEQDTTQLTAELPHLTHHDLRHNTGLMPDQYYHWPA